MNRYLLALASASLFACTGDPAAPTAEPVGEAQSPEVPAERAALKRHMHEHFMQLADIREAMASGDTAHIEIAAYWLAQHASPRDAPESWLPHLTRMRSAAARLETAEGTAATLKAADELQAACTGCHEANGIDVELPPAMTPVGD